ncbi:MAG: hypothetical protein KGI43_06755 [Alphaproteobacteria bacterium]|nr:hypothetical protein [Alphaproteobacteria bacterium]
MSEDLKPVPPAKPLRPPSPSANQRAWLQRGLTEPGGKLPLFDAKGREIDHRTIQACLDAGWAEPWFANPLNPAMQICRLTEKGRTAAEGRRAKTPPKT